MLHLANDATLCLVSKGRNRKKQHCSPLKQRSVSFSMHPSIVYTHFPMQSGLQGFAGAYPSCQWAWSSVYRRATWSFLFGLTHLFLDYATIMQTPHRKAQGVGIDRASYSLATKPPFAPKNCAILRGVKKKNKQQHQVVTFCILLFIGSFEYATSHYQVKWGRYVNSRFTTHIVTKHL